MKRPNYVVEACNPLFLHIICPCIFQKQIEKLTQWGGRGLSVHVAARYYIYSSDRSSDWMFWTSFAWYGIRVIGQYQISTHCHSSLTETYHMGVHNTVIASVLPLMFHYCSGMLGWIWIWAPCYSNPTPHCWGWVLIQGKPLLHKSRGDLI